jgi:ribonucleotide monophosphatase NagD (HAD superfamily)
MQEAIKLNLPAVCPNPDLVAYRGNTPIYTGGTFAKIYEDMGGKVYYFGKPNKSFYELTLKLYDGPHYSKKAILGIGDNIETDILGANNFAIDSLLIKKTGLCKKYNDGELLDILKQKNLHPFIINEFEI